jgi:uncharacterized protein YjaZ
MLIETIDALAGLRAALEAPEGQRDEVFRARVMGPTRSCWEPVLGMMSHGAPPPDDPEMDAARRFAMFRPECGVEVGLQALDMFDRAGSWAACTEALRTAERALDPAAHGIQLERTVLILTLFDPQVSNGKMGDYTGSHQAGLVWVQAWPTDFNLPRLPGAVAHEFHHGVRFRFEPFSPVTTSVGQYVVAEGLAEAFAAQLFGDDKLHPVVNALTDAELDRVRPRFREGLDVTGFNVIRGYIFGDWAAEAAGYEKQGIPDFAGYALGYRLVRAYLERSGRTAADATYLPWREIVEGSGYL